MCLRSHTEIPQLGRDRSRLPPGSEHADRRLARLKARRDPRSVRLGQAEPTMEQRADRAAARAAESGAFDERETPGRNRCDDAENGAYADALRTLALTELVRLDPP